MMYIETDKYRENAKKQRMYAYTKSIHNENLKNEKRCRT